MKPLPTLTLDLREKTLSEVEGINVLDVNSPAVIANIKILDGGYDHAGEIVDRCNSYPLLVKQLRFRAIVETQKSGVPRVEYDGHRCLCCGRTWKTGQPETHASDCVLRGTDETDQQSGR